ncbi:MAG: inositol monophosphatase family protein [bacterium]|nr:inositol monophosphatase family protein [bacterium]
METFIKNLAKGAGAILKAGYKEKVKTNTKSWALDLVTNYDLASNNFIVSKIKKKFPDHGILSEEIKGFIKKDKFWIVDPIDGTFCFVNHLGRFSVSIAYVEKDEIKYGAVYSPMENELFFAEKDCGAFMNNKRISISENKKIYGSSGYVWIYSNPNNLHNYQSIYKKLFNHLFFPIIFPSTAVFLAEAAMGRIDFGVSQGCYPWDYAASALVLSEAGAKVTQIDGKPYRWDSRSLLAANPVLHKKIINALNKG